MRRTIPRVVAGGVVIGVLDILDAIIFFGIRNGTTPGRIFRGIAAGLLGRGAITGGIGTTLVGAGLHFFIAICIATTYYLFSRVAPVLIRRPIVCGAIYGIGVWLFMNFVVVPYSAMGRGPFVGGPVINGLLIHMFGVGMPAALSARWAAGRRSP